MIVFEVIDKTGRKIRLTDKQWRHIRQDHPEIEGEELIKETVESPTKITSPYDGNKKYYYRYFKNRKSEDKWLLVVIKYLNGDGFVITSFYVKNIR
jgi:hypothetical protein